MKGEILHILKHAQGHVSGQELCEKFGVSRTAVWKAVNQLKAEGYEIEAVTNKGYRIVSCPDVISAEEVKSLLATKWAGQQIAYYPVLDSTNNRAKRMAEEGAPPRDSDSGRRADRRTGTEGEKLGNPAEIVDCHDIDHSSEAASGKGVYAHSGAGNGSSISMQGTSGASGED